LKGRLAFEIAKAGCRDWGEPLLAAVGQTDPLPELASSQTSRSQRNQPPRLPASQRPASGHQVVKWSLIRRRSLQLCRRPGSVAPAFHREGD
jgi:hypothetical protein